MNATASFVISFRTSVQMNDVNSVKALIEISCSQQKFHHDSSFRQLPRQPSINPHQKFPHLRQFRKLNPDSSAFKKLIPCMSQFIPRTTSPMKTLRTTNDWKCLHKCSCFPHHFSIVCVFCIFFREIKCKMMSYSRLINLCFVE